MKTLITNAKVINEERLEDFDVLIENDKIIEIGKDLQHKKANEVIDAENLYLLPGIIDDQVHFREPGLTHKATIASESSAAVIGGITSFMEMPNVIPPTTNMEAIEEKLRIAQATSLANFSFYMGATNENIEDLLALDESLVCGVKVFMGASTGSLLVDNHDALDKIFSSIKIPIVTHCEDNEMIVKELNKVKKEYGDQIPVKLHPTIRCADACEKSTRLAISLAKKYSSNLHVLHISTAQELKLFSDQPLKNKKITAEVCVHHLWFNEDDYDKLGNQIKCNPAIKTKQDQEALIKAVNSNRLDIIATDHAPHTILEKKGLYTETPAGIPLVQHSLLSLIDHFKNGRFRLENKEQKACHNPALRFGVKNRGFIREGYYADLVLLNLNKGTKVNKQSIKYKCKWSPFLGHKFNSKIEKTFVNGKIIYDGQSLIVSNRFVRPLEFNRDP